jgi:hypothetical protein
VRRRRAIRRRAPNIWAELTSSDAEAGVEVVYHGPDGSVKAEGDPVGVDDADEGKENDEGGVEPVDVPVPVLPGQRSIGDVDFGSGVLVASTTERNVVLGAVREGLSLLGRRRGCHFDGRVEHDLRNL